MPENATLEAWDFLIDELKNKVESNHDDAKIALQEFGTTWDAIAYSLFVNPDQYLKSLLKSKSEIVSDVEACWRAILSNLLSLNSNKNDSSFFTIQEEVLIKTIMGIQNCPTGQHINILSSYVALEPKYKYNLKISTQNTASHLQSQEKYLSAIAFVQKFIDSQTREDLDLMAIDLVNHVNGNLRENSVLINDLLMDTKFWDPDEVDILRLNKTGAIELLNIAKAESVKPFCLEFVVKLVKKIVESLFNSESPLMHDLCELKNMEVIQGSHQSLYLRNLIGHFVGISNQIVFDKNSGVLKSTMVEKSREEVLKLFFKYMTPKIVVDELVKAINRSPQETRELFANFLVDDDLYFQDGQAFKIKEYGSLVLLISFGFLN